MSLALHDFSPNDRLFCLFIYFWILRSVLEIFLPIILMVFSWFFFQKSTNRHRRPFQLKVYELVYEFALFNQYMYSLCFKQFYRLSQFKTGSTQQSLMGEIWVPIKSIYNSYNHSKVPICAFVYWCLIQLHWNSMQFVTFSSPTANDRRLSSHIFWFSHEYNVIAYLNRCS